LIENEESALPSISPWIERTGSDLFCSGAENVIEAVREFHVNTVIVVDYYDVPIVKLRRD
jgi:hypothetical protein